MAVKMVNYSCTRELFKASFISMIILITVGCQRPGNYSQIAGRTMGTTYECTFNDVDHVRQVQTAVDSLLDLVNAAASTYIPNAIISRFNRLDTGLCTTMSDPAMKHFHSMIELSRDIFDASDGFYEPTLMPLVNYWGFGYKERIKKSTIDQLAIDSLVELIGLDKINFIEEGDSICYFKERKGMELDLSALAKGYAVDLIAAYLAKNGAENYYVNIGGEVVVKGVNPRGSDWTLGINYPDTAAGLQELYSSIQLHSGAMATSGNYRNFYSAGDNQFAHTINPKTGLAIPSDLHSVTIVSSNCATADAYATACMAMGYGRARTLVEAHSDLEGFFIFSEQNAAGLKHYATLNLRSQLNLKE